MLGRVISEQPGGGGGMALDAEGGAVFLTQPDGSTQLYLLTPDQRQQVVAAEAWKVPPQELQTYTVRN